MFYTENMKLSALIHLACGYQTDCLNYHMSRTYTVSILFLEEVFGEYSISNLNGVLWQKEDQLPSIFTPLGGTQCLMSCRIEGPSYFLNIGQRPLSFLPQSGQLMTQQL